MWFLKRLNNDEIHYLLVGKQYIIGRKNAEILIHNDPSISRKHAIFSLSHPESNLSNLERLPIVTVKDVGSKYGTYVNNSQKIDLEAVILKAGDKITFGQCDSIYQLFYDPIIITTSCVEKENKEQLKSLIQRLGGHVLPEWSKNCTHLVMNQIKVTIKAVCAMISLKPVVTKGYFENMILQAERNKDLPDYESYIPDLGEPILDRDTTAFHCKKERQLMFQNKTFICTSPKQYKKLHLPITSAGGKVILLDSEKQAMDDLFLSSDTCVMKYQSDSSQSSQLVPHYVAKIEEVLKKNEKRMIPESDIGLAVVYCSTERYCNPDFNTASSLFAANKLYSQSLSQQDVFVVDTESSPARFDVNSRKSSCVSHVSDTFERKSTVTPLNSNPQDEAQSHVRHESPCSQKRLLHFLQRHLSESEPSPKQIKLQSMAIKQENCISAGDESSLALKDGQLPNISKVVVKTEVAPKCDVKTLTLESDDWFELAVDNSHHTSSDASVSAVNTKTENSSRVTKEPEPENELDLQSEKNDRHCLKDEALFCTSVDGFLSKQPNYLATSKGDTAREEQIFDEALPSKLLKVEFASLCPRQSVQSMQSKNDRNRMSRPVKNFKKFHKIYSTGSRLPIIIGGRDLVVYNKNGSRDYDSWLNDNSNVLSQENEEVGLFDWDSNRRSR